MTSNPALTELGFYVLPGHTDSPGDALIEARQGEAHGLGAAFISERFNVKDAGVLSGAVGAVTERIGIATAATNHNSLCLRTRASASGSPIRLGSLPSTWAPK